MLCGSIFSQIVAIGAGISDPTPIPSEWVLGVKLLGGAVACWDWCLRFGGKGIKALESCATALDRSP